MLKCHAKKTRVIVPFYAKSAALLIALGAHELVMCRSAELGPIDPQVRDPVTGIFVPTHLIKEALSFIEGAKDKRVKLQLSEKLSPLLIGAYRESAVSTKQTLEEVLSKLNGSKHDVVYTFSDRFLSHGYPIDREMMKSVGIRLSEPDENLEQLISDLHETYEDIILKFYGHHPEEAEQGMLLLKSSDRFAVVFASEELHQNPKIEQNLYTEFKLQISG